MELIQRIGIQLQADVLAAALGLASLFVTTFIAVTLHRISRRMSESEAIRSINDSWTNFHRTILEGENHQLFWQYIQSSTNFSGLGEKGHHIILMYVNNIHTEYYCFKKRIFGDYEVAYLDTLLTPLLPKRHDVIKLIRASGFDSAFVEFCEQRMNRLAAAV